MSEEDKWAWHYEKSGLFSVRSAYLLIIETKRRRVDWLEHRASSSNIDSTKKKWTRLWKLQVPAKLKHFAWRLSRTSIPTEVVRRHRNITDADICPICNATEDTWKHALVECNMAKSVWSLVDEELVDHLIACNFDDARLWLIELHESMGQETLSRHM